MNPAKRAAGPQEQQAQKRPASLLACVATLLLCFAAYVLFEGQIAFNEFITGAGLAVLVTIYAYLIQRCARPLGAFTESVPVVARAFAKLASGLARSIAPLSTLTLRGRSPGRALTVPFTAGNMDDSTTRTRRAIAVLAASLGPDRFVVRTAPPEGKVILHDISGNTEANSEWLI